MLHQHISMVDGHSPLEGAAENSRVQMIFFLWEVNKVCFDIEECRRAMELAEGNGFMACRGAIAELSQKRVATLPAPSLFFYMACGTSAGG
jgi:hypothetical protein